MDEPVMLSHRCRQGYEQRRIVTEGMCRDHVSRLIQQPERIGIGTVFRDEEGDPVVTGTVGADAPAILLHPLRMYRECFQHPFHRLLKIGYAVSVH